jgi:type IV secretory pathway protease TraF
VKRSESKLLELRGVSLVTIQRLEQMVAAVAMVTSTMGAKPTPRFVWNASKSEPIGDSHFINHARG